MSSHQPISLTHDQSRAARRELALSQKDVITQTGVQAYKLKQFEAGSFRPDGATLRKLRDFYEGQGVNFEALDAHLKSIGLVAAGDENAASVQAKLKPGLTHTPRPGFFISNDLPESVVDKLMAEMEASDDRIAELVKVAAKNGLMGDMTAQTENDVRELFGHLAANHLRFRCLQGRNIIAPTRDEAKTVGDHLAQWAQEKNLAHVVPDLAGVSALSAPAKQPNSQE